MKKIFQNNDEEATEAPLNIPKNIHKYEGDFVVFFSDKKNSKVLYHSPISSEAYKKAKEIQQETGKQPTVLRINKAKEGNLSHFLFAY